MCTPLFNHDRAIRSMRSFALGKITQPGQSIRYLGAVEPYGWKKASIKLCGIGTHWSDIAITSHATLKKLTCQRVISSSRCGWYCSVTEIQIWSRGDQRAIALLIQRQWPKWLLAAQ